MLPRLFALLRPAIILAPPPTEAICEVGKKRNGNRSRYVASSNRAQLLLPVSVRLPLSPCPVEGGQMGCGGGREEHSSSATRLHGGCLPVADTGVYVPKVGRLSKQEGLRWVWQGTLSQVGGWFCPESRGWQNGKCSYRRWCVLTAPSVCGGVVSSSDGRRCREKPWAYRQGRYPHSCSVA